MSNSTYGRLRMDDIYQLIEQGRAFSRPQIQQIFFPFKSGKNKCQERLRCMTKEGRIKKYHKHTYTPAIYYVDRKPTNMEHILGINDCYVALMTQKKPWQIVEWKWSYEILGGMVIADAYANIYLQPDRKNRITVFIENECDPRKRFDKDVQYNRIFDEDWVNEEWSVIQDNKAIFPTILIVTNHPPKIEHNPNKLRFIVATPEQVQTDVFSLIKR